ncbi:hypothetical protein ABZ816_21180 [Actinosynnema sp. NPDC047251]|uniref:Uncharacterized protein n=1 Tax=Saccharothrix espanaensis (strain ATCC 51144 / DSM 44229 / JCM 9112 / NBRC 15066 / NRRL 15764) TaxID=1179773 RepID=K0KE90_SACES|nr:hypothetical protein [Saccharothrix espanaensis]CCH35079.1 hypothetical protein BN6_78610 [Saccharothrix espanaensis DSM 44229]
MDTARAAAFGDRPGADVRRAAAGPPRERWFAAVALGGQGHYAAAATLLHPLVRSGDRLIASLAASTLASHRRQLGSHATARRFDALALAAAPADSAPDHDGVDAAGARADALLGLAADALGAGRLREARRLHARVVTPSWRGTVRKHWVAAEIELAAGYPQRAVEPAERALEHAEAVGATRHILKSGLVLGTASVVWGTPESVDRGVRLLQCDLTHTDRHGLLSLSWPTALVLLTSPVVRNDAETERIRKSAVNALSCVLRRADPISRRLAAHSPWIPTALLRSGEPPNADAQPNFLTD